MFAGAVVAGDRTCSVNVNVSVTEAGRKVTPPTPEHPAYYYPVLAGWREEGAVEAGEKAPRKEALIKPLARVLAAQGYLVVGTHTPPPTLLLVLHWGSINPDMDETMDDEGNTWQQVLNERQMLALVGGSTLNALDLGFERDEVMQAAHEDRYFVVVSAFDFADATKKKKTLLWRARMSTPSAGVVMADVVKAMVESGGPYFGRSTTRPLWVEAPVRQGRVDVGELIVVPEKTDAAGANESGAAPATEKR